MQLKLRKEKENIQKPSTSKKFKMAYMLKPTEGSECYSEHRRTACDHVIFHQDDLR